MYGKAYESQYEGSMVGAGLNVFAVWNYVIAKTHFGTVELNPKLVAAVLGGRVDEVVGAIEFLCRPDPESRSKLEDGRRMVKEGQFQYRVVNWGEYQAIKSETALKEYNRRKQAEYRAKKKAEVASGVRTAPVRKSRAQVRAESAAREARFVQAMESGDVERADRVAAEGLPTLAGAGETIARVGPHPMEDSPIETTLQEGPDQFAGVSEMPIENIGTAPKIGRLEFGKGASEP